jgi:restriction system protein
MSAVTFKITSSNAVNLNCDDDFDLVKLDGNPISFFDKIKSNIEITQNVFGYKFKCNAVKYNKLDLYGDLVVESEYIDDLCVNVEYKILELYVNWNIDYVKSIITDDQILYFKDEVVKNNYLQNLHIKNFQTEDYWFENPFFKTLENGRLVKLIDLINKIPFQFAKDDFIITTSEEPLLDISFWDTVMGKENTIRAKYDEDLRIHELYQKSNEFNTLRNKKAFEFNQRVKKEFDILINEIKNKESYLSELVSRNKTIIEQYESKLNLDNYFKKVLENLIINKVYSLSYNFEIISNEGHFILDIQLPLTDDISKAKDYKENKRDGSISAVLHSEKDFYKVYNNIILSITFRVLNELFSSDFKNQLCRITFNGWVNSINKRNGNLENKCILSISVDKDKFNGLNLEYIDLKLAFNDLKGISASNLYDYTPVAPIINISKEDKRFIQSVDILKNIDNTTNIAAINWEDFEHLVRELFEKEFSVNGGEVMVTQSSRDGGVDAIAFDPDPIRGGKIVIQSKRYTNVVGVSAIRDLYGTVLNEGATKGIIVTTSHYGNDAYEFAKGKPLSLLDGNNLLSLLQKHGYKARIDLNEAKELNKNLL